MRFTKYHALGNDYLVITPGDFPGPLSPEQVRMICHRNFGIGSDGILFGPVPAEDAKFGLRIFNPDGSEAEKSGNGLRIFSRFLWDRKLVGTEEFTIRTPGGVVRSQVMEQGRMVGVEMGRVSFQSGLIPMTGPPREVLNEPLVVGERTFTICAATIGNPHCVILVPETSSELAHRYGSQIELHPSFPRRTNVQFLQVLDRKNLRIEIWERGAGYTLASGSSSSASAAVARRLGLCDASVTIHMPGGRLQISISDDYSIHMTGPVTFIGEGSLSSEMFEKAG